MTSIDFTASISEIQLRNAINRCDTFIEAASLRTADISRANHDLGLEVPPFEERWPRFDHGIYCTYYTRWLSFCNTARVEAVQRAMIDYVPALRFSGKFD